MFKVRTTVGKPVIRERKMEITGWCYEFPLWFSVPGEDFWVPTQGTGRPLEGIQSTSAIKLISHKVAPQQCVWVCKKSFMEKRVREEISMVRWAGELLLPAQVGMAGECLPACSALPEQCPGSGLLLSLSLSSVPWYHALVDNPSA